MKESKGSELIQLAHEIAEECLSQKLTIATGESCTGGWIAKMLTDLDGSSQWFQGGIVSYSNQAKQSLLHVEAQLFETDGAVSESVVQQMVSGVIEQFDTSCAVAVTGIAGPTGGTDEKPIGTVWIGWQLKGEKPQAKRFQFSGNRNLVRKQTVYEALSGILAIIRR